MVVYNTALAFFCSYLDFIRMSSFMRTSALFLILAPLKGPEIFVRVIWRAKPGHSVMRKFALFKTLFSRAKPGLKFY